jgi:hypothetical protein
MKKLIYCLSCIFYLTFGSDGVVSLRIESDIRKICKLSLENFKSLHEFPYFRLLLYPVESLSSIDTLAQEHRIALWRTAHEFCNRDVFVLHFLHNSLLLMSTKRYVFKSELFHDLSKQPCMDRDNISRTGQYAHYIFSHETIYEAIEGLMHQYMLIQGHSFPKKAKILDEVKRYQDGSSRGEEKKEEPSGTYRNGLMLMNFLNDVDNYYLTRPLEDDSI